MTVSELITELQKFDGDMIVGIKVRGNENHVDELIVTDWLQYDEDEDGNYDDSVVMIMDFWGDKESPELYAGEEEE